MREPVIGMTSSTVIVQAKALVKNDGSLRRNALILLLRSMFRDKEVEEKGGGGPGL